MKPEMATNRSTRMLTPVKILFIVVDSLTPNAKTPLWANREHLTLSAANNQRESLSEGDAV